MSHRKFIACPKGLRASEKGNNFILFFFNYKLMTKTSETLILILILVFIFVVPLLIIAGTQYWSVVKILLGSSFIVFLLLILSGGLLILGVIVAYSYPKTGKIMAYIGIGGVLISLIVFEIFIAIIASFRNAGVDINAADLMKEIKEKSIKYESFSSCDSLPVVKGKSGISLGDSLSCIITGYLPKNVSTIYYLGFWIFGVVMPLLITSGIFNDLVESAGIINNRISRRLIGWGLGFIAYRGLLITGFIFILDYVSAGMAIIVLNFIFVGGLLSYTNRIFSQWKPLEDAIDMSKSITVGTTNVRTILRTARDLVNQNNLNAAKAILTSNQSTFIQADPTTKLWDMVSTYLIGATSEADFLKNLNQKGIKKYM